MGRVALGAFQSTPLDIVAAESDLTPARPLLNRRQAKFTQRLLTRPQPQSQAQRGPDAISVCRGSAPTERLRTSTLCKKKKRRESNAPSSWAGMAEWLAALVRLLQIMGSNPSQPHILREVCRRKAEEGDRWRNRFFGAITKYWLQ